MLGDERIKKNGRYPQQAGVFLGCRRVHRETLRTASPAPRKSFRDPAKTVEHRFHRDQNLTAFDDVETLQAVSEAINRLAFGYLDPVALL